MQVGDDVVEQLETALAELGSEQTKVVCLVRISLLILQIKP